MRELRSLEDLLELQSVDSKIDRLLQQRPSLPELAEYKAAHEASVVATTEAERLGSDLRDIELKVDKAEGELEVAEAKLKTEERRLFAGGLSARETENLQLEVDGLQKRISGAEEETLRLLDVREGLQEESRRAGALAEERSSEESRLHGLVTDAWERIDARIGTHEDRKESVVVLIDPELLATYERIRETREDGVAVTRLADGICGGCHLALSNAEQAEVLRGNPPRCLHCARILVP